MGSKFKFKFVNKANLVHNFSWYVHLFSLHVSGKYVLIIRRKKCIYATLRWSRGSVLAFGTQVRGFAPGRSLRIFRAKKILSTPSFGGEIKPSVPCRSFTACKRYVNVTCKPAKLPDISRPQLHLPPLGALAWWHAWRRLVAKVGTSNPDRTISFKGCRA